MWASLLDMLLCKSVWLRVTLNVILFLHKVTYVHVYVCPYLTRTESNGSKSERSSKLTVVLASCPQTCTQQCFFLLPLFSPWVCFVAFDEATLSLHNSNNFVLITLKTNYSCPNIENYYCPFESRMQCEKHHTNGDYMLLQRATSLWGLTS